MRRVTLVLAGLLPLAACQSEPEPDVNATNASIEEVAEQVREASVEEQFIQPGKWVSTISFEEMSAPGIPEGAAERMNKLLGDAQSFESCLTREEANRPSERFFTGDDRQCRYESFTMGGGEIDATMRCERDGIAQVMEMEGTYSPGSYSLSMASTVEGEGTADVTMRMRIDAKRVGQCDQTETTSE